MPAVFHMDNPAFKLVWSILFVVMFFMFVDVMCCMSANKKKFVPYYLEPTNQQKNLKEKVEVSK